MSKKISFFFVFVFAAIGAQAACSSDANIGQPDAGAADTTTDGSFDGAARADVDPKAVLCSEEQRSTGFCNDKDKCTAGDKCDVNGVCVGEPITCDDNQICTEDRCDVKVGCLFPPWNKALPCNDGNECTTKDLCNSSGECLGTAAPSCDDSNPCTTDSCDSKKGCLHSFKTGSPCEDGDLCTKPDLCVDGLCKAGGKITCDDGNTCTFDQCEAADGSCVYQPLGDGQPCSDGDACTNGDACKQAVCVPGQKKLCDDNDTCTSESCNTASGTCEKSFTGTIFTVCTDSNACTEKDTCEKSLGYCQGIPTKCEDGNECTVDLCDKTAGCINKSDDGKACSDGSLCTQEDKCKQSKCQGVLLACNDGNACTSDVCNPEKGACSYTPMPGVQCTDGNMCTKDDTCSQVGSCTGDKTPCSDGNLCTSDNCDPVAGCKYSNINGIQCSDGNPCTSGDTCQEGVCKYKLNACDDGNMCTKDICNPDGTCAHTPLNSPGFTYTCTDPTNLCASKDGGICQGDGSCMLAPKCNDNKTCTLDVCDPSTGACKYNPIPGCTP